MFTENSALDRALNAFLDGEALSAKQIAARYKVKNAHDVVYALRNEGYDIALVRGSGRRVNKYVMAA